MSTEFNPVQIAASLKHDLVLSDVVLPQFGLLTPEMLLEYCASKIRGIDEQVQRAFSKQQSQNRLSTALADIATRLQDHEGIIPKENGDLKNEIAEYFTKAINAAGANSEIGKSLETMKARLLEHGALEDEIKSWIESVGRSQTTVNREGELQMIQLQSVMSQRQQAIQMCTNLVSALGQSSMAIAQNMGK